MTTLIATPSFDGKVQDSFLLSLLATRDEIDIDLLIVPGIHFADTARDVAAAKFLMGKADRLFFIDADLGWDAKAVVRMIERDKDVIGGAYPIKNDRELYPVWPTGVPDADGLFKATALPGGFMCIRRNVLEALAGIVPHYAFAVGDKFIDVPNVFGRALVDGRMVSEDMMFCRRALSAGFELWLDPDIDFTHCGSKYWKGNYLKMYNSKVTE